MFLGQYQHSLDIKNRTSIPKKFRTLLADGAVLTLGLDGCLFLYEKNEWQKLADRMTQLPLTASDARSFSRYLFSNAVEVGFDGLGRIKIPEYLISQANLKKKLIIIGVLNRIEIWAEETWSTMAKKIAKSSVKTAEKLTGSGI